MKKARGGFKNIIGFVVLVLIIALVFFLMKNNWDMQAAAQQMLGLFSKK